MIFSTVSAYENDVAILKDYNGLQRRLYLCKRLRKKGFEFNNNSKYRGTVHSEKLEESIIRSKSRVFELAICNDWTYFITLTIDKNKYNRYDLKKYHKDLSQWLRNYKKKFVIDIKYLLIPEQHKNGAWHMHGFISGLPLDHLCINNYGYYDWFSYKKKFGYCSLDFIHDKTKASSYVTKYITKDLSNTVKELNANLYYCSQGLERAKTIKKGQLNCELSNPTFANDYVQVKCYDKEIPVNKLLSLID